MRGCGAIHVTEPISTGAAGTAKLLAMIFGSATLAAFVVMVTVQPQTRREWAVALICTVLSSISGGSAVVMWLGLQAWALDFFGLMGLGGLFFA